MLLDLLKKRYSCRNFAETPVPPEVVAYMLECGRLSASGGNEQPWKFGVVTDRALIGELAQAAGVNYPQRWIANAPLVIALCTRMFDDVAGDVGLRRFPSLHDRLQEVDRELYCIANMEEHQTKIPGEHMVMAALEHGIYSTWISSVDCERAAALLNLTDYRVTNLIAFGYPAERGKQASKKALDDIVFYR